MKKILLSVLTIALVATVAVGATQALFSDTEESTGNTFTAGSLDLVIDEETTLPFVITDVMPLDEDTGVVSLTNTGSVPGTLSMTWTKTIDDENDMITPETISYPRPLGGAGSTTGDYAGNGGELDIFLQFAPFVDSNGDESFNSGDIQLAYNGQSTSYPGYRSGALYFTGLNSYLTPWSDFITLGSGETVDIVIPWRFPSETTDNNYHQNMSMTDSLGFDVEFVLTQVTP